jgi:hypothetical protein
VVDVGQVLEEESHVLLGILWAEEWSQGTAVCLNCVVFGYYACCFVHPPSLFLSLQVLSLSLSLSPHNTVAEVWKLGDLEKKILPTSLVSIYFPAWMFQQKNLF